MTVEDLNVMLEERLEVRKAKNFERSDEIRAQLAAKGVMLMDGGDGSMWRPAPVIDESSS